ncbi:MAG: hypothetical protein ACRC5D_01745, partial [Aeromonas allosaccharophila]
GQCHPDDTVVTAGGIRDCAHIRAASEMRNGERSGARKSVEIVMSQASEYQGTGLNSQGSHTVRSILPTIMEYWRGQNHD